MTPPRALKACPHCGDPTPKTPCRNCTPSGRHTRSAKERGNTRRMANLSRRVRQAQPFCGWPTGCDYTIDDDNPLTLGHLIPRTVDPTRMYDKTNCITLCQRHNSRQGTRVLTLDGRLLTADEWRAETRGTS